MNKIFGVSLPFIAAYLIFFFQFLNTKLIFYFLKALTPEKIELSDDIKKICYEVTSQFYDHFSFIISMFISIASSIEMIIKSNNYLTNCLIIFVCLIWIFLWILYLLPENKDLNNKSKKIIAMNVISFLMISVSFSISLYENGVLSFQTDLN